MKAILEGLDEGDNQLILKQNNSKFVIYEILPRVYTIKDIAEAVYNMGDHKWTPQIE